MSNHEYISRLATGYVVRKRIKGSIKQAFFGDKKYGSKEEALTHAITYRDQLLESIKRSGEFIPSNTRNVSGIVGVAWHCRENRTRVGAVSHLFRAQAPNPEGGASDPIAMSFSVQKFGLWDSYVRAASWRFENAYGQAISEKKLLSAFQGFLGRFIDKMEDEKGEVESEMRMALVQMAIDDSVPEEVKAQIPAKIMKRLHTPRASTDIDKLEQHA